ncbi:MAG: glycosyltransferase family 2 protein [Candidatus Levyibacteriota bacterium]
MISVIILTYNSQNYIGKLLKSLVSKYKSEIDAGKLEIIVADNNSSDGTISKARETKNIIVINNGDNFGFAKGINLASKKAKGKFLLFINPDSKFLKGDIFSLMQKFENDKVAVVGGEILRTNGERELSVGKFYNFINTVLLSLGLEEKLGVRMSPSKDKYVDFVSGGFMMVMRDVWERLGGFDEKFFMYVEDMEFCYRVKKQGFRVLFSGSATIEHIGQGSGSKSFAIENIYKGLVYFHKKHKSLLSYSLVKTMLLFKASVLVLVGKLSNNEYLDKTYSRAIKQLA